MGGYKYSIQLLFDEASENLVLSYINEFRAQGLLNADFIDDHYKPHISLAVYRELPQEYTAQVLQLVATRCAQFRLNFSHIGIFSAELKALYLGPTFSTALRDIHSLLHMHYRERPEKCWDYYLPDNWVPHCGVMLDNESDNIIQGLHLLMSKSLPQVKIISIVATGFSQPISYALKAET